MENKKELSILTDESLMPFGKFAGTKMCNVPYWHLLWLHQEQPVEKSYNAYMRNKYPEVFLYIEENLDALIIEKNKNRRNSDVDTSSMFNTY